MLAASLGAAVGLILALTGAGGGVLAVPLLMFGLGLRVNEAAPVALTAVGLAAGLGALMGLRHGHLRYRAAGFMALLGMAGAPLGWWIGRHTPSGPLTLLFSAVLAYAALRMLRLARAHGTDGAPGPQRLPACRIDPQEGRLRWTAPCARALGAVGFAAGLLSSLLGVGGGFVIVPSLLRVTDLDMQSIATTSLAVIALVSVGGIAISWVAGHELQMAVAAPFAGGALAGLLLGRSLARRLSGPHLQRSFAVLSLAVAAWMAWRALAPA